ncbi:hypothetical protein FHW19_000780 [Ochrobactrum anthropi]|nr:hypothetical protein [Brucella anthropi]NIH74110.1 hypothetical protein [Ochrobactrum sp. P20RRXII]
MMDKGFACFGKGNAASSPLQKQNLPGGLHVTQALACRWKRQADFSRTMSDAAGIGDSEEEAKVGKIKAHKQC